MHGLLTERASIIPEQRLQELWHVGSVVMVQGLVALQQVESSQTRDWTRVSCIGRQILIHCTTREVLVLYFHLPFLLWIKILHSTYYTLLLTLTSRNRDRRGNEGKRIKLHFCWAGSLPPPSSHPPPQTTTSLNQIQHQRDVLECQVLGQEREPGIYTGEVKSIHEHTAWVSFPNTEMKLTVILRVDQGKDQKSSYWSY